MAGSPPPVWFMPAVVLGAVWLPVWAISRTSGWRTLAREYPADRPMPARRMRTGYGVFRGWVGYNGCLIVASDPQGLHLATWPVLLAWCHPPVFLPWREVRIEHRRLWIGQDLARVVAVRVPEVNFALRDRTWAFARDDARRAGVPGA